MENLSLLPPEQQAAILDGPALTPPGGIVPNFDNPPNNNRVAYATLAICLCASSLAVCIRACSRLFVVKAVRLEDILAVAGFGTYVGYIYLNYWLLVNFGFFVHQWDIQVKNLSPILYHIYVGGSLYGVTVGLVKFAVLKEWSRIFVPWPTRNIFWWTCHALIFFNVAFYSAGLFVGNLACIPREKIWDKTIPGGKCIDAKVSDLSASIVNVTSDLLILVLPQRIIWKLKMPLKKKIGVSLIFTIGVLACLSAAFRLSVTIICGDDLHVSGVLYAGSAEGVRRQWARI
ncbi:hypothetical protein DL768_004021 [Monosporascus sp. mg162]|nr:hypothetical protein DL768_004021 [Monosporascus sp. mg162]